MGRYRRWRVEGATYFFTVVTYQRQRLLTDDHARECLRGALEQVRSRLPFRLLAIVLLPDHLHTVWELPRGDADYSTRWRQVKSMFTRAYRARLSPHRSRSASRGRRHEQLIWQRRFFEHTCRDEQDVQRCVDYVHINPVKHRLVERVRDWPWSSFHHYARCGAYPLDWGSSTEWYGDEFRGAE